MKINSYGFHPRVGLNLVINQFAATQCQHIPRQAISHATGIHWVFFLSPILCDSQLL